MWFLGLGYRVFSAWGFGLVVFVFSVLVLGFSGVGLLAWAERMLELQG